jgi:hypothetical protein
LQVEIKGLVGSAKEDQQNLHFGISSSVWVVVPESSSGPEIITLSTSSYSSNSSS